MRRAAACLICAIPLVAQESYVRAVAPRQFQLPDDVVPKKYTVTLTIDPSRATFDGKMHIQLESPKDFRILWLNAKGLTVTNAALFQGDTVGQPEPVYLNDEFLGFQVRGSGLPYSPEIVVNYQGRLDDKALSGIYRRKVDGEWYAYTTFTPIDARRAFPCFDEPRFKAPWEISIRTKRENKAFSNGRQLSETEEPDGWKLVKFATTEPLPAELVAFAVGPFDVNQGGLAGHGTPVRVITAKGLASQGHAAAQAATEILPRLEAYTGIPYPFGKLDYLALPEGAFGAVENPGLITYLARNSLVDPAKETPALIRAIRALEAHELGHQWFGNLVTQATWNDVWLSEGFATWIASKMMDQEQPPERLHLSSIATRESLMMIDTVRARPVRVGVTNRLGARDIYNRMVYEKGAAILMMLEGWLGEDRFRDGLNTYLKQHSFGNAATEDLAAALRTASGNDPARVLNTFLDTSGVPELHGQLLCDRPSAPRLQVTKSSPGSVPVCWRTDRVPASCTVLEGPSTEIVMPVGTACPAWFYLNSGGTGYYRTRWTRLSEAPLRALSELSAAERLTLVYDLRLNKSAAARAALANLVSDAQPEIANASRAALK